MTRYVLADLRQTGDELARRAADLTAWLDRAAAAHDPDRPPETAPAEMVLADLACVRAVSAAAHRLSAAALAMSACAGAMQDVDEEAARRLCRWSG